MIASVKCMAVFLLSLCPVPLFCLGVSLSAIMNCVCRCTQTPDPINKRD